MLLPGVGVWLFFNGPSLGLSAYCGLDRPLAVGIIVRSPCAEVMFRVAGGRPPAVGGAGFFDLPKRNDMAPLPLRWAAEGEALRGVLRNDHSDKVCPARG